MPTLSILTPDQRKIARSVYGHHAINADMGGAYNSLREQIGEAQVALGIAFSFSEKWSADIARAFLKACGFSDEVAKCLISDDQPECWY